MESGKKETFSEKLNAIAIGDNYLQKIAHELQNIDINQISDNTVIECGTKQSRQ